MVTGPVVEDVGTSGATPELCNVDSVGLIIAVGARWAMGRMLAVGVDCGYTFTLCEDGVAVGRTVAVNGVLPPPLIESSHR